MAWRGRGRGRGRFGGGGGFGYARQEPFVLFPEVELPDPKEVKEERALFIWNRKLQNYWKSSPYHLEEIGAKNSESMDIERYSDMNKPKTAWERGSLDQFLQLGSNNFPKELDGGLKRRRPTKKVRWVTDPDLQKLDIFEKMEHKHEGQEERDEKQKKEGEDEEEEGEEAKADEEEYSDDGDYNQNVDFDDDEDDFNVDDGGDDDEPIF